MELNRDEIIKAMECCRYDSGDICVECPYVDREVDVIENCQNVLFNDAISLIKSLTATNESLEAAIVALKEECAAQAEEFKRVKANTIQTFAERLKRYYDRNDRYLGYSIAYNIDQVAQAMLNKAAPDNKCVACGDIIPEGRQVCPGCEGGEK